MELKFTAMFTRAHSSTFSELEESSLSPHILFLLFNINMLHFIRI